MEGLGFIYIYRLDRQVLQSLVQISYNFFMSEQLEELAGVVSSVAVFFNLSGTEFETRPDFGDQHKP